MPPFKARDLLGQRPASWAGFASDPAADSTDNPPTSRQKRKNRDSVVSVDSSASDQPPQTFRRITGYHNARDEVGPPDYDSDSDVASITSAASIRSAPPAPTLRTFFDEEPPDYSSSIDAEGVVGMKMERTTPFDEVERPFWTEAHIILRGTLLEVRRVKSPGLFTHYMKKPRKEKNPLGRLLRSYTLQHAEVGLAADYKKVELVPKNLAQLLGPASLKELQETDPDQFDVVYNYVLRLRLEGEQVLFRFPTPEERGKWLDHFCAAVDIAPPLDMRTEPRYQTLPRRRRRQGPRAEGGALVQQQERIMREHYPQLSCIFEDRAVRDGPNNEFETSHLDTHDGDNHAGDPDAEDLDTTFMTAPDTASSRHRQSALSTFPIPEEPPDSEEQVEFFDADGIQPASPGKWNPGIELDPSREARYRRRCMPNLVYNSRHANEVIIRDGKQVVIDWEERKMKPVRPASPAPSQQSRQGDVQSEPPPYAASERSFRPETVASESRCRNERPPRQPHVDGSVESTTPSPTSTAHTRVERGKAYAYDDQSEKSHKTVGRSWKRELASLFTLRIKRKIGRRRHKGTSGGDDEKLGDERLRRLDHAAPGRKRSRSVMDLSRQSQIPATRTNHGVFRRFGIS